MSRMLHLILILIFSVFPLYADLPEGAFVYQLDNGMQVLLIENHMLPMTGVNVVVKTGSAYETFASSGMSHMLEHLLFNGTTTRSQKQLYDDVDLIGGYNNAHTSDFCTNFMMVTPAAKIEKGMEIQADMLFNSVLPEDKFEKEKGIVLEEIAQSISKPDEQIERNISHVLYTGHALSLPTLGTYATIRAMKRDDVYEYYKNAYVPNNMIINVVGNFDSQDMLKMIRDIYGVYKPGTVIHPEYEDWHMGTEPVGIPEGQADLFYDGDMVQIAMFYQTGMDITAAFADLLQAALDKKKDLIKENIDKQLPDQITEMQTEVHQDPVASYLAVTLNVKPGSSLQKITDLCREEMKKTEFRLSPDEIKYHITRARTDFLQNLEKPHMFGIYNAETFAIYGIGAVLNNYTASEYRKAGMLLNTFSLDKEPFILINHPQPVSGVKDTTRQVHDKLFVDPETGLTLIVRQNPASQLLAVHMLFKHKAKYEAEYGKDAAKILHDCLGQRLNSPENQKLSESFGFTFTVNDNPYIPMDDIYLHPDFSYVRAEGLADDYPAAIAYLNGQMASFVPTRTEYERAIGKFTGPGTMGMMSKQKGAETFREAYSAIIYEPDRYNAAAEQPGFDQLVKFARIYFNPDNMIVSIVSPGKPDEIYNIYHKFNPGPQTAIPDTAAAYDRDYISLKEPVMKEMTAGGDQAFLFWGYTKNIDEKDEPALTALSLVLSDTIVFDIREKQGRAYRMRTGIEIGRKRALFYLNMGTRPENIDPVLAQMENFFNPEIVESLTSEKLTRSVNMYIGRMMFRRLSSINQAYYLGHSYYFFGDMYHDRDFHEKLQQVTLEEVKAVAARYLQYKATAVVIVK
jgi:zinc protease